MAILLSFSVGNFRSFRETRTFTMQAQSIMDEPKENVVELNSHKYLTTAAIYGANSSGKSNLIRALARMGVLVQDSAKLNDKELLPYEPFMLNMDSRSLPTSFEVVFMDGDIIRYGFSYNQTAIISEWLFITPLGKREEKLLFARDEEGIGVDEKLFGEGNGLEEKTNENRLFLSVVSQLGGKTASRVMQFFNGAYHVISGLDSFGYGGLTEYLFNEHDDIASKVLEFFHDLKLGFEEIETQEEEIPAEYIRRWSLTEQRKLIGQKHIRVFSTHNIYGSDGQVIGQERFDFTEMESRGTEKLFEIAGPIFDALNTGTLLVIDELDAKMHPLLSQEIIRLFNSSQYNPKHAQLIFSTHDTNLLSAKLLRRDQIWFTEKNAREESDLYNVMDIVLPDGSKPRSDANLERNYIRGRYGAVPYLNESRWYEKEESK